MQSSSDCRRLAVRPEGLMSLATEDRIGKCIQETLKRVLHRTLRADREVG